MLEVKNLRTNYGSIEALKGISITTEKGAIFSVIGANGAGKSTLVKTISGLIKPSFGEIWFESKRIDTLSPPEIVRIGISYSQERAPMFPQMSVIDNILVGGYLIKSSKELARRVEQVFQHFPILQERRYQKANTLSGGQKQMLSLARVMMSKPKLLMLDEPSLGLAPLVVQELAKIMTQIAAQGLEMLIVEQNFWLAHKLSKWLYVMELGKIVLQGSPSELEQNELLQKAYLG
jgi:branched-chain amino acid transport system ATP-binding protein